MAVTEPEQELDRLVVVDRPRDDGTYRRAAFGPAWADTDHNSCNQRDDALFAAVDKGRPFTMRRQHACDHDMISGTWPDPYSDQSMTFGDLKDQEQARALPVDHIVALAVSWRYGADNWTPERRLQFATDLEQSATHLMRDQRNQERPRCRRLATPQRPAMPLRHPLYQDQAAYTLPVDRSEKQALRDMLKRC